MFCRSTNRIHCYLGSFEGRFVEMMMGDHGPGKKIVARIGLCVNGNTHIFEKWWFLEKGGS